MENVNMTREILEYSRKFFDTAFDSAASIHDQTEKILIDFWGRASWIASETKEVVANWSDIFRKGRDDLKGLTDKSYKRIEEYLSERGNMARPKTRGIK